MKFVLVFISLPTRFGKSDCFDHLYWKSDSATSIVVHISCNGTDDGTGSPVQFRGDCSRVCR